MSEYRGLVNEGSTCYLNSLLQTLFMTPEFRSKVYSYVHDEKKIKATDSIPYQLQKIFVKLQLNSESVYSKGLLRSFQWNEHESFTQHDVQQFCRILFQALEKSHKGSNWIQQLYSGTMESFISCEKHTRCTPEIFMDLSLPIRNPYTNKYSQSVEECLYDYLKPEVLDDKIFCDECGEKVKVTKGTRFANLPQILTLQLNRFELNYTTFQRQKVNSFLYFPEILELHRFMKPFEQIELKGIPEDLKNKTVIREKQKSARSTNYWGDSGLKISGEAIKKRKNSDEIQSKKEKIKFYDEQNKDKHTEDTRQLTAEEQKMKNLQLLKEFKADQDKMNSKMKKLEKLDEKTKEKQLKQPQQTKNTTVQESSKTESAAYDPLEDDMLFGSFMKDVDKSFQTGSFQKSQTVGSNAKAGPSFEKTVASFQHVEESYDINKQYPENTYILYSILVHSGGAYGGHYYAYIFNGLDWYRFDDNKVTKAEKSEIRKYGNPTQSANFGANAYLLFYRKANSFKKMQQTIEIPQNLLQKVKNDLTVETVPQTKKFNRMDQINNSLIVKIFMDSKTQQSFVVNKVQETIESLRQKAKDLFGIQEKEQNWRLRRYNKLEDSMHQIYGQSTYNQYLHDLGMRETSYFIVQTKKDDEEFSEYDPRNITIKINVWRQNLTILTQQYLKPIKIGIRDESTFEEFYEKVKKASKLNEPVIIKRNFSVGNPLIIFGFEQNKDKTLISLRFFNGINLYVEQKTSQNVVKWMQQFLDESYRCCIKFNNPKEGTQKDCEIFIDSRKTLGELKQKIAQIIDLSTEQFRIKKSQNMVSQLSTFKKKLIDMRITNNQFLHIQIGKSSKGQIIVRKGMVSVIQDQIDFSLGEEFMTEINGQISTVADLKNKISQKYGIDTFNIRVRQYKSHQFSQIFPDTETLQRIRDKSLVWEQIQIEDPRGIQIYLRVFDPINMQFKPLQSIFVEMTGNYEEFTMIIEEETQIQSDKVLVWKSLSNYIEKSMMFDCEWIETRFIQNSIRQQPLYITNDGQILIIKQAAQSYHQKPNKKYRSALEYESAAVGSSRKGQTAMKITVIEENEDIIEEGDNCQEKETTNV